MKAKLLMFFLLAAVALMWSCDPHVPPSIEFKTGANYISQDTTVAKDTSLTVGIIARKKEDDMKTYNISYAYDGAQSTTTQQTFTLTGSEEQYYEKDYTFRVRNQAGVEEWSFVITDRDGNIAKLKLKITVK
ncbi:MAG TPA: hypothetical protein VIM75_22290 [Ohtaekwangia sp.]|uniref:hypothetical protein n=1 Tax=Ohtaekwangia sp. TaxID=2066019 RepID=UPI002F934939